MRRKIKFLKLFNRHDNYSTEIRFEVFRWLLSSGWEYRSEGYWGSSGLFEQIWGLTSVNSQYYWDDYGFSDSEYDEKIRLAFIRIMLSDDCDEIVKKWRTLS